MPAAIWLLSRTLCSRQAYELDFQAPEQHLDAHDPRPRRRTAAAKPTDRIYSWQRVHHPVHPVLADCGPYTVVLIELPHADNLRLLGNLLGDPMQDIVIGSNVEAVFEDHDDGDPPYTLVHWQVPGG